ncbi:MAG: phosphate ABC transporter substrate-binding protein [Euryarchaeota archaeon]|jgi:phosphate transport system substrate-binding protein|nr:phosphate ABC transporter substrate-binding protein [Euryarchaeota archaeon]
MKLKHGLGLVLILIIATAVYSTIITEKQYERIDVAGSTSVQPVAEALAQEYMKAHPRVKITVQGGGSGLGIRSVSQDIVAIGTSSMELNDNEGGKLKEYVIGKEGIVVAVNLKNPVDVISKDDLRAIFTGNISNWKELGGPDAPINVVVREDGSGTRKTFDDLVLKKTDKVKSDAIVQISTESIKLVVEQDPNAIGYISLAHMSPNVKAVKVDGVYPSMETILGGTYELHRPFLFLTKGEAKGAVKEFLEWCLSPEGQKIVENEKIVPVAS